MRILVTGGAGYVGSLLSAALLHDGHHVRVLDSLMFGAEAIVGLMEAPGFSLHVADVRSPDAVKRALGDVETVIHLAALVGEPACAKCPDVTWEINAAATKSLVDLACAAGVGRFIFASTCSNYGVSDPNGDADESAPLHPLSLYAETKIEAEQTVLAARTDTFHPCVLRLATVFGLSPRMRFNLLVNQFVRDAVCRGEVTLYRPQAWRPLTHVRDAVDAYRRCLVAPLEQIDGQVFNVGTANYRKSDLVDILRQTIPGLRVQTHEGTSDPRDYRVSFARVRDALGFAPAYTLDAAVTAMQAALNDGVFRNPYDAMYDAWFDERQLVPWGTSPA